MVNSESDLNNLNNIYYSIENVKIHSIRIIILINTAISPTLKILYPLENSIYTDKFDPLNFSIEVFDQHLDKIWFTVSGNTHKHLISENGTINEIV